MELDSLLKLVTVDCKDNSHTFITKDRINAIREILNQSRYHLLHEGRLCYIYGKEPVYGESVVLISSHIDCVYNHLFCEDYSEKYYKGTFDNSLTNACVLKNMLDDSFSHNVIIAFTGDEEEDSNGAKEVFRTLSKWNTNISTAIVLDVTEAGWDEQCSFTVENDLGIDIMKAHKIVDILNNYEAKMCFVHDAEADETWEYDEHDIPCFSLCLPTFGDMHSDEGVLARKRDLPEYCKIMEMLANGLADAMSDDRTYYIEVARDEICGIYVNEDDCRSDNYISVTAKDNTLKLPTHFHGIEIRGIKDFVCMGGLRTKTPPIKGLIIPESYKYIGQKNFSKYNSLEFVFLPENVRLRSFAFAYCSNLRKVFVGSPENQRQWREASNSPNSIYKGDYHDINPHGLFEKCHEDLYFYY